MWLNQLHPNTGGICVKTMEIQIESSMNVVKLLPLVNVKQIENTNRQIQLIYKQSDNNTEKPFTPSAVSLFYRPVLLTQIKADVEICHADLSSHQSAMLTMGEKLKDLTDHVLYDYWCVLWLWFQTKMLKIDDRNEQTTCQPTEI